jgi:parvulin-like peptidyl-prolyl isomerase
MSQRARKNKVDSSEQAAARLARERERKNRRTAYIIAGIVVATVLTIFGVFYYQNLIAPFRKVVIKVDDVEIRMEYFIERCRFSGSDPWDMLQVLATETAIKLEAPDYGINVTEQDIAHELRRIAVGGSENLTISEPEFKEWYLQKLNDTGVSDEFYREIIETQLLINRLQKYVAQQTPTVVEHAYLHLITVMTYDEAVEARSRLDAGESFATVAREMSLDASGDNGGEIGWIPRGASTVYNVAFALNISEIKGPSPYSPDALSGPSFYYIIMVSGKEVRQADEQYVSTLQVMAFARWLEVAPLRHNVTYHGSSGGGFDSETYAWVNYQLAKRAGS